MELVLKSLTFFVRMLLSFYFSVILELLILEYPFFLTLLTNFNSELVCYGFIQILHQVFFKILLQFVQQSDLILLCCISLFSSYSWVGRECIDLLLTCISISAVLAFNGHDLLRLFFFLLNLINFVIIYEVSWVHDALLRDLDVIVQPVWSLCNEFGHWFS